MGVGGPKSFNRKIPNVAVSENITNVVTNNDNNDAELKSQEFDPHEEFKHENVKVESVDDNVVQAIVDATDRIG